MTSKATAECGTYAGAHRHWDRHESMCDPCARAAMRVRKRNIYLRMTGQPQTVDKTGTARRIRALQRIGWTLPAISDHAHMPVRSLEHSLRARSKKVYRTTAAKVAEVYNELCMTFPEGAYAERTRRRAERAGWPPPLAWDDDTIDDPNAEPDGLGYQPLGPILVRGRLVWPDEPVDEVVVTRILNGDWQLKCSRAEKCAVVARWTGDRNELARRTGWKVERYIAREEPAA